MTNIYRQISGTWNLHAR